jgi:ribosome maturation factor RimP
MAASTEQSKILAKLRKRRKDVNYDKIKETEAQAGGRKLPGGLKDAVAVITGADIVERGQNDTPCFIINATCVEPEECKGIGCDVSYFLEDSEYENYSDVIGRLLNDLKLMGFEDEVTAADDENELMEKIMELCSDKDNQLAYTFNTANRANKSGYYRVYVQGLPDEDYEIPNLDGSPQEEAKAKKDGYSKQKKTPKKSAFSVGDKVTTSNDHFDDGNDYTGEVTEVDGDSITVHFDDDDTTDIVPANNLTKIESEEEADDEGLQEGDAVQTINDHYKDGETWTGVVIAVEGDTATVEFEDESTDDVPTENLEKT